MLGRSFKIAKWKFLQKNNFGFSSKFLLGFEPINVLKSLSFSLHSANAVILTLNISWLKLLINFSISSIRSNNRCHIQGPGRPFTVLLLYVAFPLRRKREKFMIIVYWFYYVYDKINLPLPPSVLSPKNWVAFSTFFWFSNFYFLYVRKMSKLTSVKINSAEKHSGEEEKWNWSRFRLYRRSRPPPPPLHPCTTREKWSEKLFFKKHHVAIFLCGYTIPFHRIVISFLFPSLKS